METSGAKQVEKGLGTMPSMEAMRLFVKILEEDDPTWYSRASKVIPDPVVDVQINTTKDEPVVENGNSFSETKTISAENGGLAETQDKDVVSEDPNTVSVYNQWTAPQTSGQRPKARYEHGAAVIQDKMYIYGGNHNGRYLGDLHVLDLKSWTWSRVETKVATESEETSPTLLSPCAGHSLIPWDNKLLSIGGHTKDHSESMQVKVFDTHTSTWSMLKTYGKPPVSRGGQSVTVVGKTLVIFGGQDAKRSLLNDLHVLDLETMTWDEIDALGVSPSPAGFDGSESSAKNVSSKFSNDTALLLYALYQQATVGPCNTPKPSAWRPVEQSKWKSWQGLGTMPSMEAMRLFVKILEEDDPTWYSRASKDIPDPVVDVQINATKDEPVVENGNSLSETKTISAENGGLAETQDKDVVSEDPNTVSVYNQWTAPQTSGQRPKARYEHGTAVIQDKMYIYGGNHNGRYLGDLHVLDLKSWTWSRVETKVATESEETSPTFLLSPCAGHSLIPWDNKLLSIGGHTKDHSESMQVKVFDTHTYTWSMLKTYGKPPVSRGGQSVTVVGKTLVIFGGQDAKRSLLNDLHVLDLETMTWDEIDALGVSPSPRSDHAAAVHAERYLLIFGGGSHATCFDDLHVLDLQTVS
ncbi:hypothetical protein F2Q68_00018258 [Brassica cretica]|uniref:ACB domain-containing protein n=1 Tax=Brassica cretica TaxID=69181 RepID=A0A8S9HCT7_BRACR|nr:hypothetical protein F2Q68_00018258 [Brassica cretica]